MGQAYADVLRMTLPLVLASIAIAIMYGRTLHVLQGLYAPSTVIFNINWLVMRSQRCVTFATALSLADSPHEVVSGSHAVQGQVKGWWC